MFVFTMLNFGFVYWISYSSRFWYNLFYFGATFELCLSLIGLAQLLGVFTMDKFKMFKIPVMGAMAVICFGCLWIFSWWLSDWAYLFMWMIPKSAILGFTLYLVRFGCMHGNSPLFGVQSKKFCVLGVHVYWGSILFELIIYFFFVCCNIGGVRLYMWFWFIFMI
jgi:hypothetical protein